jgi:rod shape-determining protein MreC
VDRTPPPFFKRGPAPLVRLFFFGSLSLALLVIDARFRYAEGLRTWLALAAYPLQRVATAPIDLLTTVSEYVATQTHLLQENSELRAQALASAENAQRYAAAEAELGELRRLMGSAERLPVQSVAAEVIYAARDPYAHKIFIDRGSAQGVAPGSPVADEAGVVGQVTRVHALLSEVTLLTNPDQAIPVQVVRNGLRAIAFGAGTSGMLELRYVGANVEIQNGDQLVTSGIDGTYPPGLAVASVVAIERDAEHSFARVLCRPTAGVERGRYVLVLGSEARLPPRPEEAQPGKGRAEKSRRPRTKEKDTREKAPERPAE